GGLILVDLAHAGDPELVLLLADEVERGAEVRFAGGKALADGVVMDAAPEAALEVSLQRHAQGLDTPAVNIVHAERAAGGIEERMAVEVMAQRTGRLPARATAEVERQQRAASGQQPTDRGGGIADLAVHVRVVARAAVVGRVIGEFDRA